VRDFFQRFGFTHSSMHQNEWVLDVSSYQRQDTYLHLAQSGPSIHTPEDL